MISEELSQDDVDRMLAQISNVRVNMSADEGRRAAQMIKKRNRRLALRRLTDLILLYGPSAVVITALGYMVLRSL